MRTICALCSMLLLFSFTGIQAQTESVPAASDSLQAPVSDPAPTPEASKITESTSEKPFQMRPLQPSQKNNGLLGTVLFSCNGLYYYNKSVVTNTYSYYDGYSGTVEEVEFETTYKTYMYAILFNANYFVAEGFSIGGTLGVLSMTSKSESDRENYHDRTYSTSVNLIGPRLAYYHGKKDSKVLPFAAFEYDLITAEYYNDNAMRIGAGILLQPKPHFGISFGLDYLKLGKEKKSTNIMGVLGLTGILY